MLRLTLSESEVEKLELEARQQMGRVSERIHFVLLCHRGYSAPRIGELFNYTEETVRSWLKRYQEQGLLGLIDEPRSGRPPKDPLLKAVVECQLGQSPRCFGYLRTFNVIKPAPSDMPAGVANDSVIPAPKMVNDVPAVVISGQTVDGKRQPKVSPDTPVVAADTPPKPTVQLSHDERVITPSRPKHKGTYYSQWPIVEPVASVKPTSKFGYVVLVVILLFAATFFSVKWSLPPAPKPTEVSIAPLPTKTAKPLTATTIPPTKTAKSPTPTPDSNMVRIPAGEFGMGSDAGEADEKPVHKVYLADYYIDKYETTNAQYAECVNAGKCTVPHETKSYTRDSYYNKAEFANYPVIYVDWTQAKNYCEFVGKRLPTEAEWEKAARGTDGRIYPWGNEFDGKKLNYCDKNCPFDWADKGVDDGYADTSPVGSYELGQSVYGVYDMNGNVWEWTSSDYKGYLYIVHDGHENLLKIITKYFVVARGASSTSTRAPLFVTALILLTMTSLLVPVALSSYFIFNHSKISNSGFRFKPIFLKSSYHGKLLYIVIH